MEHLVKELDALSDDDLRTRIAAAQAMLRAQARHTPLSAHSAIGMWQDREEMQDSAAWVRDVRKRAWRDAP